MPPRARLPIAAEAFALLAEDQDRVLSRDQLVDVGWNHDRIADRVASERWSAHGAQAIVLHRGPLTVRQRRWIAVINGGPYATLAGITAAQEYGLQGFDTETIHIVIPREAWAPSRQEGVYTHISRRFSLTDRHPAKRLSIVRQSRAIVDAAAWSSRPRRACALVIAAVQQRLTTPAQLRDELAATGRIRHRRLLWHVIGDVEGGTHALAELDLRRLCQRYQLPMPKQQHRRHDATGRVRYIDASFRRPDGRVFNVEIDGAAHFNVVDAWADMQRDLSFLAGGIPTARIPGAIVRMDPAAVAEHLRRLLDSPW